MNTTSATLELAAELVRRPSVTPDDHGCQQLLAGRLSALGFACHHLRFGEVDNLWSRRGRNGPLFVFAGHTDVVPTGPSEAWSHPPFAARVRDGKLFGRGAADMKGSLAAMVTACARFVSGHPGHAGSIGFLITSDEEGPAVDGTRRVMEWLHQHGDAIDWCLIGEPSSHEHTGDTIKVGRRGSMTGSLRVFGRQGHVAYPDRANNPIHRCAPLINTLSERVWDHGSALFPATSFQVSNISGGTGAGNVIPGHVDILFNFRFSPERSAAQLRVEVETLCRELELSFEIDWTVFGEPFHTPGGRLVEATVRAIDQETGLTTVQSTTGGTSDGRFIAPSGAEVLELGPVNRSIHDIDEHVSVAGLETLSRIYQRLLETLLLD